MVPARALAEHRIGEPNQRLRGMRGPRLATKGHEPAEAAGIKTKIGNHTFWATGITAYLKNDGTLEKAAAMANHASTRTTQLYDLT